MTKLQELRTVRASVDDFFTKYPQISEQELLTLLMISPDLTLQQVGEEIDAATPKMAVRRVLAKRRMRH